jgi:hypothetical protein
MAKKRTLRTLLVVTVCLLTLNAIEEVMIYKLQRTIDDPYMLTGILLVMFSAGFVLVAGLLTPRVRDAVKGAHKTSKKTLGLPGVVALYAGLVLLFFIVYFVIYTRGPQYLLPRAWR